ncbi:hypothetical protein [Planctomicrobium sp. SH664]|uniref:hypothetical protein n=1 Tax=Planctomicrobium sp. SH664 TaxID=3448125 RepID=UPI003F5C00B6
MHYEIACPSCYSEVFTPIDDRHVVCDSCRRVFKLPTLPDSDTGPEHVDLQCHEPFAQCYE